LTGGEKDKRIQGIASASNCSIQEAGGNAEQQCWVEKPIGGDKKSGAGEQEDHSRNQLQSCEFLRLRRHGPATQRGGWSRGKLATTDFELRE